MTAAAVVQVDVLPYTDYVLTLPDVEYPPGTPLTPSTALCRASVTAGSASGATVSAGDMTYSGTPGTWLYTVPGDGIIPLRILFARLQVYNVAGSVRHYTAPMRLRPIY